MLHVHRSERADSLVGPLAEVLAAPPGDPFAPELVAVPTKGVERWLAQRLAHRLGAAPGTEAGVCANIAFSSPGRLVGSVLAGVLGGGTDDDPWRVEPLTWAVLATLDDAVDEPWCAALARHLGHASAGSPPAPAGNPDRHDPDELRRGRRLAVARHVAGLLTAYGAQRPDLVTAWAAGRDEDGAGAPVPADLRWQPELWRRVRARLGVPGPAERLDAALAALATTAPPDVPGRLSVFGPTRLPEDQLRVLHALGRHRDVHLWLVHPSPALWAAVAARGVPESRRRAAVGPVARLPVLASMARDVVELQTRLLGLDGAADGTGVVDVPHPAPAPPPTLLGALQSALRADAEPAAPHRLDAGDRSVRVHACHGRARQVEVLREVLVGLFAEDPTLEPRDVLVMCPDVEAVAPLVAATFGLAPDGEAPADAHPGQTLRVRVADRSLRQTNPHLGLLAALLDLADGRVTASEVLDLAASPPVRYRFGFDEDDLDQIREWSAAAGAHWGEDAGRRARFGLGLVRQGTWDAALDRILLGAAMAEEDHRFVGPALPLDDVDSTGVALAGRFAELVDRLGSVLARLDGRRPVADWLDTLDDALDLLAGAPPTEAWQGVQARQVLAEVRQAAAGRDGTVLRLPDVRALLADRLAGRPTRAGFRTGALTVCSLEPMRAVPHRVVALLGLDDGVFPRSSRGDGDDLLLRDPCLGERDRRSEDRQLFLDAVAAAGERLVVLYTGADERTGALRPPAVPVAELLDALDRTAASPGEAPVRSQVVVRHPLQPVDERNFAAGALGTPGPFSHDRAAHRAAVVARGERRDRVPFLPAALPAPPRPDTVDVGDLADLLEHPARWFLRNRLGVALPADEEDVVDRLPLALDGLGTWAIGDRLLAARLAGVDRDRARNAEWRRGEVPPRQLGRAALDRVLGQVVPVAAAVQPYLSGEPTVVDVTADLPVGIAVTGSVDGVHGDTVARAVFSRLGAKHRLRAWVQLLALVAADPDRPWQAVTIGRAGGRRGGAQRATLTAPSHATAQTVLENLVRLRERALRAPLPLPAAAGAAYARSRLAGDSAEQALGEAASAWKQLYEVEDRYHVFVWGPAAPIGLVAGVPERDEAAWSADGTDTTRLGVLALRVWKPLLAHEEVRTV
ncbi:exodeoxyribonuclease V subunit gamma [Kineosporia sp. A_224]|uniref:exodeoxyribonuclease V subunit gamma n=1 Tax=Kineosporia sp. A_224 TaxID=1962180 RepID=UPI000B4C08B0|nr:exodeoxyribonuclease V subunit gamma [Kineosporia sp. A_224]